MKSIQRFYHDFYLALLALFGFITIVPIFTYIYFSPDLTSKDNIMNRNDTGLVLLDSEGEPFFNFYQAKNKKFISINKIPKHLQEAIIAAEDKEFYRHEGFSFRGIIRSIILDIREQKLKAGGSTITQQLVKNSLLNPKKEFLRKYQEIILAYEIERKYSKDEILEMYLNSVYFGEGAFGVEQAAQTYFDKSAEELTLSESSLLTALLPSPSRLSPYVGNKDELRSRQKYVLQEMEKEKYISAEQKDSSEKEKIYFRRNTDLTNSVGFHFALMVRDELINKYGEEHLARSGYKVKTTLNIKWQRFAEKIVQENVEKLKLNNVSNGAALAIDPKNGEIKALVGSKDWNNKDFGKVNIATSLRQPGSSFKPIVYATAFEKGVITPASVLKDQPTTFSSTGQITFITDNQNELYNPKNYDGKFRGSVLVRRALANSLNVPAVEVLSKTGIKETIDMAHRLGINSLRQPSNYGLSLALGAGEVRLLDLTNVYATFANNGKKNQPTAILEVKDHKDQIIYKHSPKTEIILSPEYAFLISSILSDAKIRKEVFGNTLDTNLSAAVKTGTTENYRDAWTIGYTPSLAIGVWVGNNDGKPMDSIAGSLGAAPIWKSLIEEFSKNTPKEEFVPPAKIVKATICSDGSLLKHATNSGIQEYFIQGTLPNKLCGIKTIISQPKNDSSDKEDKEKPDSEETKRILREYNLELDTEISEGNINIKYED